jgi:hypothetical protein
MAVVDQDNTEALEFLASEIKAKQCVLFLGAGVHAGPPNDSAFDYPVEHRPPIGKELSRELARRLKLAERYPDERDDDLQRVSLFFEILRGGSQLVTAVSEIVCDGKKPSPMLKALAELDFPVVFTTNYDPLFEHALFLADKTPRVAIYTPTVQETTVHRHPDATKPIVAKLHGDVAQGKTIVITDEDYVHFVLRMGDKVPYDPIPLNLKGILSEWTTLFVGYSLLDYNLRLLFKTLRWGVDPRNVPDTYSVDYRPDPLILDVWDRQNRLVKFIAQDVWSFVPELYKRVLGKELTP